MLIHQVQIYLPKQWKSWSALVDHFENPGKAPDPRNRIIEVWGRPQRAITAGFMQAFTAERGALVDAFMEGFGDGLVCVATVLAFSQISRKALPGDAQITMWDPGLDVGSRGAVRFPPWVSTQGASVEISFTRGMMISAPDRDGWVVLRGGEKQT